MKELRVLLGVYLLSLLVLLACRKVVDVPVPVIDLGKKSTAFAFKSIPYVENGTVVFKMQATVGAKYSIQVIDIRGDVKVKQGLLASSELELIKLPLDKVNIGAYDLVVLDITGAEIKLPIIKKI